MLGLAVSGAVAAAPSPADAAEPGRASILRPGFSFGPWTIATVHPLERGAIRVEVRSENDAAFELEIMAHDPSARAVRPPATAGALAIFVRNGGDGDAATAEDHGRAAMTLGQLLERNDQAGPIDGLLTHEARTARHGSVLLRPAE